MAELKRRTRWKKWAPDVGENRELEGGPVLFLDIAVDLTPAQLSEMSERLRTSSEAKTMDEFRADMRRGYVEALGPYVRVHGGPHTVDGLLLATLEDYLALVTASASAGVEQLRELVAAVVSFNSLTGPDELFSLPRSGGVRTTGAQSNDAAASPTASP